MVRSVIRKNLLARMVACWSIFGLIGMAIPGLNFVVLTLPAVPFYLLSEALSDHPVRSGWFWDSAHSPPFLNIPGILLVYVLPGIVAAVVLVGWGRASVRT